MQGINARAKVSRCIEGQDLAFEGVVSGINRYEYSSFMNNNYFGIDIKTGDTTNKFIYWQFTLKENKDLLNIVSVGQGVRKVKGSKTFTLFVTKDVEKEFALPYCN